MRRAQAFAVVVLLATGSASAQEKGGQGPQPDGVYTFGIGRFTPSFTPPAPGTYELPPIETIDDHPLVDSSGRDTTLARVVGDHLAIVSFIYGACGERTGCPMSTAVLHDLDARITADSRLARNVSLVSVSFDPQRDVPARLAERQAMRARGSTWQFVTTHDEVSLAPLLDDFGQSISRLWNVDGTWTGTYRHVLKVFLLDRERRVRNIYSVGFLDADLLWNDLETLLLAETAKARAQPKRAV